MAELQTGGVLGGRLLRKQSDRADATLEVNKMNAATQQVTALQNQIKGLVDQASATVQALDQSGVPRTDPRFHKALQPIAMSALRLAATAEQSRLPGTSGLTDTITAQFKNLVLMPTPEQKAVTEGKAKGAGAVAEVDAIAERAGVPREGVLQEKNLIPTPDEKGGGPFGGTGFEAQSANMVIALAPKIRAGTANEQERQAYAIAYNRLTAPRIVGTPDTGFSLVQNTLDTRVFPPPDAGGSAIGQPPEPARPTRGERNVGGQRVTPLGERERTPERAGRTALITQGAQIATSIKNQIINEDGSINRSLVWSMATDIPFAGKGVPGSEGRTLRAQIEDALAGKLRLETGAQANEKELQNIIDRFMPSPLFDSDETIIDKMNRLEEFFNNSLQLTDPDLYQDLIERSGQPQPPEDEPGAVFVERRNGNPVFRRPDGSMFMVTPDGEN